jgi:hypothetical protein
MTHQVSLIQLTKFTPYHCVLDVNASNIRTVLLELMLDKPAIQHLDSAEHAISRGISAVCLVLPAIVCFVKIDVASMV